MKYADALKKWLSSDDGQFLKGVLNRHNCSISEVSPSSLPDKYNDVKFDGCHVRKGKFLRTVGEYKEAYSGEKYE